LSHGNICTESILSVELNGNAHKKPKPTVKLSAASETAVHSQRTHLGRPCISQAEVTFALNVKSVMVDIKLMTSTLVSLGLLLRFEPWQ